MKKVSGFVLAVFGIGLVSSCNNAETTTTQTDNTVVADSTNQAAMQTTTTTTTTTSQPVAANVRTIKLNPSASYVDLSSGKKVRLRVDTVTKYIVNEVTNQPIMYYIDPTTNDTFDRQGRIVNRALRRGSSGDYTVDESYFSSQSSDNSAGDTMSGTTSTGTVSGTTGSSKEKIKDDKYKYKDPNVKVKAKDDKTKVKTNQ